MSAKKWSKAISHMNSMVTDVVKGALLTVALLVTLVASLFIGNKAPAILFDGVHKLHLEKYTTVLSSYRDQLSASNIGSLDSLITEVSGFSQKHAIARPLLECLQTLTESENPRKAYQEFVRKLDVVATLIEDRKLNTSTSKETLRCIEIAETLAINRWSGVDMEAHFDARIDLAAGNPQRPQTLAELPDRMREINHQIEHASPDTTKSKLSLARQKLSGTAGIENFTGNRNTPNLLATLTYDRPGKTSQEIKYIRHGSPTHGKDLSLTNASEGIVPNYELFLRAAAKRGQGVFYAIHQRLTGGGFDDESGRTNAILALQARHPNFHAMVQPIEGKFFAKKGETAVSALREEFIHEFFENSENPTCALPNALKGDHSYRTAFIELLGTVQNIFFSGKSSLSESERKQFILFFYAFQRMDLKTRLGGEDQPIGYYVTACKDDLDRGGSQALLELALHLIITGQAENPGQLSHLINHLLGPPIIVKQIGMLSRRLEQVLPAIEYITKNAEILERLRDHTFSGHAPTAVTFSGA